MIWSQYSALVTCVPFLHFVNTTVLYFADAYVANNFAVMYGTEGESISINCTYNPKENQWREKSWCRHISKTVCQHVVSARRFWMPFLKRRNGTTAIADDIQKGILTVIINPLKKEDAGLYQYKADFLGSMNTLCKVKLKVLQGKSLVFYLNAAF